MSIADDKSHLHTINRWLGLVDDPAYPHTSLHGGYVLRTGRNGLIELLGKWRVAGVNHATLDIQLSAKPVAEAIQEPTEEVLPLSPSHSSMQPANMDWQLTGLVNRT